MDELLHNDYSNDAAGLQINFFGYAQKFACFLQLRKENQLSFLSYYIKN